MTEARETSMIERVAKAIDAAEVEWCLRTQESVAEMPVELKARAAFEAMRAITAPMARAGLLALDRYEELNADTHGQIIDVRPNVCWQAMLDAILSPME